MKVHVVPPDNVLPDWAWWLSGVAGQQTITIQRNVTIMKLHFH